MIADRSRAILLFLSGCVSISPHLLFFITPLRHRGSTYTVQSYTVYKTIKQKHHPRKNLTEVNKH